MSPFISLFLFITLLSFNSAQITVPTELEFPSEELFTTEEQPPLSGYVPLDLTQAQNDPIIQGLFSTGAQNATQQAIQDGTLPNGTYQLARLVSVEQNQNLAPIQNYRFVADIKNNLGQNFTIQFELSYNPDQQTSEVTSYSILGQETEQPVEQETELEAPQEGFIPSEEGILAGYVPLDLDQAANDPQIQGLLQIGLRNATEQAIQDKLLRNGTYQAIRTLNIEQNLDVQNVEEYLFDVIISAVDNTDQTARLTYQLTYDPLTGTSEVTSYSILNNELEPPETYTPLNLDTISTNPLIQGLITVGSKNVTQQAIQNDSLPNGTYFVSKTNSAGQGNINSSNYQFNVSISDNRGTSADEFFTLTYDNATESVNVTSYSISNLQVPKNNTTPPKNNTTNSGGGSSKIPRGFTALDVNSNQDPRATDAGQYGFNYVVPAAMLAGQIPYSFYSLESINQVARKGDGPKRQYWFDVTASDGLGNSADLIYTVEYDPRRDAYDVKNYDVKNVERAS